MRELPTPGQAADFLSVGAGAGPYHWVRLAGAVTLGVGGATLAALMLPGAGPGGIALAAISGLLAAAAVGYLAGTLLPFSRHPVRLWLRSYAMLGDRLLLRSLLRLAGLVGDKTDPILRAFVQANNAAVRALYRHRKPKEVLVLLPHCVVYTRCPKKVVKDLARCTDCDLCQMEEVLGISSRAELPARIAIRSVEAYRQARDCGPDLTLAVACDDRLVKGITRVPELPAFAFPLHLPKEACHDNLVDVEGMKEAMRYFLGEERALGRPSGVARPTVTAVDPGGAVPTRARLARLPGLPSISGARAPRD